MNKSKRFNPAAGSNVFILKMCIPQRKLTMNLHSNRIYELRLINNLQVHKS